MELFSASKKILQFVIVFSVFTGINAQQNPYYSVSQSMSGSIGRVDKATLLLLKAELESAKKVLIEIRDGQKSSIIGSGVSAIGTAIKETLYVAFASFLGGGGACIGLSIILGPDNVEKALHSPAGQGAALIVLPIILGSSFVTYVMLKLIVGKLLAFSNSNELGKNVKEALLMIEQTLNRLDYDIMKLEQLCSSSTLYSS